MVFPPVAELVGISVVVEVFLGRLEDLVDLFWPPEVDFFLDVKEVVLDLAALDSIFLEFCLVVGAILKLILGTAKD